MPIITKQLAERILEKLGGAIEKKHSAHSVYGIYEEQGLVALLSIRHGSNREAGHDFLPRELNVSPRFARELGQCTKSRSDWIEKLKDKGLI